MVTSRFLAICGLLVLMLGSACSTQPNKHQTQHKQIPSNSPPYWINEAMLEGHLAVTASAMPQKIGEIEGQRRAALLRARAELAKNTRVFVSKSFTSQKTQDKTVVDQTLSIRAIELQKLTGAKIRAEWIDPKSRELFIWYTIPLR